MANKVIIGILVLLVVCVGCAGYYSYTLNRQIDNLSEQLSDFETTQAVRLDSMSEGLRSEMAAGLGALEDQMEQSRIRGPTSHAPGNPYRLYQGETHCGYCQ